MKRAVWIAPILALIIAGCAVMSGNAKPFADMTNQEKVTFFQDIYNKQFDDALAMAKLPNMSTGQLEVYRSKRLLLIKVKPLITTYAIIVGEGGTPTQEQEQAILNLINQLATVGG